MGDRWNALADPTRREILSLLSKKDMTAGDIADNFSISKPSISHHLNVLKNAELIDFEKNGQKIIYTINTSVFQDVMRFFMDIHKNSDKGAEDNEDN